VPDPGGGDPLPDALRLALGESGALGATSRQLAERLAALPGPVEAALDELRDRGEVLRIGRGLWLLRAYEDLAHRDDFAGPASYEERFLRENGLRLGRWTGPITFRSNETAPVHRWWPYVQGFSAEFVREILLDGEGVRGRTVLDPFAGSGTTVVEARRAGARAIGVEILPPAALAARVKTHFELPPAALTSAARRVLRAAERGAEDPPPFLRQTLRQFTPASLRALLRLRHALPREGSPVADAVRLAFGGILIPSSRLHRSPCLGYAKRPSADRLGPLPRFERRVEEMRADLGSLAGARARWGPPAEILPQDARALDLPAGSVDLAVTSPPYVNGMDYVMNYKLDLAWLGYARSYADLAALRRVEVACDNLPRSETEAHLRTDGGPDPWLDEILARIRDNVRRKGTYRRDDMHAIVRRYFVDLLPVLARLRTALKPGGRLVIVLGDSLLAGTYVPGDLLLARIGSRVGFTIDSVEVARRRRSGQRRSFELRETVVTLRRR
jgi:DNA modification methylase